MGVACDRRCPCVHGIGTSRDIPSTKPRSQVEMDAVVAELRAVPTSASWPPPPQIEPDALVPSMIRAPRPLVVVSEPREPRIYAYALGGILGLFFGLIIGATIGSTYIS